MARTVLTMILIVAAVMLTPSTTAQAPPSTRTPVTYTVGDAAGWNVLTEDAYDQWEENKTFYVGDILVFNFINGTQDVAEVTEAAYDNCNTASPISVATISPVRITLTTPGEHYYTSTMSGHCSGDQKLSIDVLASTNTSPSAPPPPTTTPTPAPTPARTPVTYTVGDAAGWNVLTEDAYDQWEENKTFYVGDILVFNFINGTQDVAEVTEAAYDSCNTTSPISVATTSPVRITLTTPGEHYFTSTISGHCSRDQKLSIDVLPSTSTTTPSTPPPSTNASAPAPPPPARTPVTYIVGDAAGWNVLTEDAYDQWEENKTFYVGDILVFNFINGTQDVAEVTETAYDTCNTTSPISVATTSPVRITLTTPGDHYFTSTMSGHCSRDQKLSIDVLASTTTTPSTPPPSTNTSAPPPPPTRTPVTYIVGDAAGWNVLTEDAYDQWEENKTFYVGDILVFNFINGTQDVAEVTEAAYDSCNTTAPLSVATNPPVRITLTTAGEHYYTSTMSGHCSRYQKLSIDVLTSSTPTTPPSASSPTTSPSPSPSSSSPSPSSSSPSPTTSSASPPPPTTTSPSGSVASPPSDSSASVIGVTSVVSMIVAAVVAVSMF